MISTGFLLGLAILLATPGPTNTLLALGAAQRGWRAAPALLAAELAAYLLAVVMIGLMVQPVLDSLPMLRAVLQALAAIYLMAAAVRLWRSGTGSAAGPVVSAGVITATTLLNPKGLIIAITLMPPGWLGAADIAAAHLGVMAVMIPVIGGLWMALGAATGRAASPGFGRRLPRFAAIALAGFALVLARAAFAG